MADGEMWSTERELTVEALQARWDTEQPRSVTLALRGGALVHFRSKDFGIKTEGHSVTEMMWVNFDRDGPGPRLLWVDAAEIAAVVLDFDPPPAEDAEPWRDLSEDDD